VLDLEASARVAIHALVVLIKKAVVLLILFPLVLCLVAVARDQLLAVKLAEFLLEMAAVTAAWASGAAVALVDIQAMAGMDKARVVRPLQGLVAAVAVDLQVLVAAVAALACTVRVQMVQREEEGVPVAPMVAAELV
jgi:hypothetical protein